MINTAITLLICILIFLIAGLITPTRTLFWMKKPDRIIVIFISSILFMAAWTLYGEGMRRKAAAQEQQPAAVEKAAPQPVEPTQPEVPAQPEEQAQP